MSNISSGRREEQRSWHTSGRGDDKGVGKPMAGERTEELATASRGEDKGVGKPLAEGRNR